MEHEKPGPSQTEEDMIRNDPLKAAVIGAGSMGETHAEAIAAYEGTELVAVVDRNEEKRVAAENLFPGINTYDDMNTMLEQETVDMIQDSTPETARAAIAETVLPEGIAVFGEKPTGPDFESAQYVAQLAEDHDPAYHVVHQERQKPGAQIIKHKLDSGDIGELQEAYLRLDQPGWYANAKDSFRTEQIMDTATHTLDLFLYLVGDEFIEDSVKTENIARENGIGIDYTGEIGMVHKDREAVSAYAEIYGQPQNGEDSANYSPGEVNQEIVLKGTDGTLTYDGTNISHNGQIIETYEVTESDIRQMEVKEFVDAYNGEENSLATPREEARVVGIAEGFLKSYEQGERIALTGASEQPEEVYASD